MGFVISWLGTAAALWVATWMIDGFDFDGAWWQFLLTALIVGLANAIVKPILRLLSLPIVVLTLGLFLLVVNALVLQFAVWLSGVFDLGLTSDGFFWDTFLAAIVVSVVGWIISFFIPDDGKVARYT